VLTPEQLAGTVLPLGTMTKEQVREQAAARGLGVADKPDSHDICFIADGDTQGFLRAHLGEQAGPVVDALTGAVVGQHTGAYGYTVGQRRGLDLRVPAADGRPRYVLSVEPVQRRVVVGPVEALDVRVLSAQRPRWTQAPVDLPLHCTVQLRAHGAVHHAVVTWDDDCWRLELETPARGVAPGQAAVLYDGDGPDAGVLGSATLTAAA
jgi:tRNA-specific 2-thiouridylase